MHYRKLIAIWNASSSNLNWKIKATLRINCNKDKTAQLQLKTSFENTLDALDTLERLIGTALTSHKIQKTLHFSNEHHIKTNERTLSTGLVTGIYLHIFSHQIDERSAQNFYKPIQTKFILTGREKSYIKPFNIRSWPIRLYLNHPYSIMISPLLL